MLYPLGALVSLLMNQTDQERLLGWQSSPGTRGTIDIIWSCASTIFVCVWVMLHLNVPAENDSEHTILLRKLKWFAMAILAPELLMLFAGGQWAAARRSVEEMQTRDPKELKWTMVHAFYAESGGFILKAARGDIQCSGQDLRSPEADLEFPITGSQMQYLVKNKYIQRPRISLEQVADMSKADGFAKVVAGAQSAWFVLQVIARGAQNLAVTLLELSTICLMTCMASAIFFWYYKPLDVRSTTLIVCESTLAKILQEAGDKAKDPYHNTPLDFCDRLGYSSTEFPGNKIWGELSRPLPRIPNDKDSLLHSWRVLLALSGPTAAFGTLQLIAWNFTFPTRTEQLMWRWTCVGGCIVLGIGCFLEAAAIVASRFTLSGMQTFHNYKSRWPWCLLFFGAGLLYLAARMIVITEVIISLRALPPSCFETVQWTSFLPHV